LDDDSVSIRTNAASTLWNLATDTLARDIIREEGGIPKLIQLLKQPETRFASLGTLRNLLATTLNRNAICEDVEGLPLFFQFLENDKLAKREMLKTLIKVLSALCMSKQYAERIRQIGGIPSLLSFISKEKDKSLPSDAMEILIYLLRDGENQTVFLQAGGMEMFIKYIVSSKSKSRQSSRSRCIATSSLRLFATLALFGQRALIEAQIHYADIQALYKEEDDEYERDAVLLLSILDSSPYVSASHTDTDFLEIVLRLLHVSRYQVFYDHLLTVLLHVNKKDNDCLTILRRNLDLFFTFLTHQTKDKSRCRNALQILLMLTPIVNDELTHSMVTRKLDAIEVCLTLLTEDELAMREGALDLLMQLSYFHGRPNRAIGESESAFKVFVDYLSHEEESYRRKALTIVSNLSHFKQVKAMIRDMGGIGKLIPLLRDDDALVKKMSVSTLCNLVYNNASNCTLIVNTDGGLDSLTILLSDSDSDVQIQAATICRQGILNGSIPSDGALYGRGILLQSLQDKITMNALAFDVSFLTPMIMLLLDEDDELREKGIELLQKLFMHSPTCQHKYLYVLLQLDTVSILIKLFQDTSKKIRQAAIKTLNILTRYSDTHAIIKDCGGISAALHVLSTSEELEDRNYAANILLSLGYFQLVRHQYY
jgi:HEAT repeat protein